MTNAEIGHRISLVRTCRRWSQAELAEATGMSTTKVHNLEKGIVNPHYEDMRRIAEALHFSLDAFGHTGPKGFDLTACLLPLKG